jgi:uncharacterized protein (TIGR02594 family)
MQYRAEMLGKYAWLDREPAPKMLRAALDLYGVKEKIGDGNNPEILAWAKECGIKGYSSDSTPWCGLWLAVIAKRSGKKIPENPLWARNWQGWGEPSPHELGAVLVFARSGGGGHVGLYCGEDKECYHVLGGNQSDSVSITRIRKERLIACRSMYKVKPPNIRPIWLDSVGGVSVNES